MPTSRAGGTRPSTSSTSLAPPLELRGRVAETGVRLYSVDEPRRVHFEADTRVRWIEFRPVVEQTTAGYLRRVASEGPR